MSRTGLLSRIGEHELQLALRLDYWRQGFDLGFAEGYREALTILPEPLDIDPPRPWPEAIDPVLDRRRYPPHSRKRFGEPRARDFPGTGAAG